MTQLTALPSLPWQVRPPVPLDAEYVRVSQRLVKQYRELWLSQGWHCAMCGKPFTAKDYAVVDHDHTTGIIRGCAHNTCNRVEGELRSMVSRWSDNPEQWLIDVGRQTSFGSSLSHSIVKVAKWCHKGVTAQQFVASLSVYLDYYKVHRTRMIHPNHRFACEGGSDYKKHDTTSKRRRGWGRRKKK